MKSVKQIVTLLLLAFAFGANAYGQSCSGGQINGIYHTSCFPWQSGANTLSIPKSSGGTNVTVNNDTPRLQRAINAALGKLVFD
jgi:hypothetical protein